MGRIGKSYPRFQPQPPASEPAPAPGSVSRLIGAVVGLIAALGLIGWLLAR